MFRKLRKRWSHSLGLSRVSEKVRKIVPVVDRSTIDERMSRGALLLFLKATRNTKAPARSPATSGSGESREIGNGSGAVSVRTIFEAMAVR